MFRVRMISSFRQAYKSALANNARISRVIGVGGHFGTDVNLNNWIKASTYSTSSFPASGFPVEFMKEETASNSNEMNSSEKIDQASIRKAVAFVMEVEDVLHDEWEKYEEFLILMSAYRNDRIDLRALKEGLMVLFKDHKDLIARFNTLLPPGEIPLPLDDDEQQV